MRDDAERRILKSFGNRVRKNRVRLGLSQEDLAERADLDRTYISGIERGLRNVALLNLYRIAEAMDVRVADLF